MRSDASPHVEAHLRATIGEPVRSPFDVIVLAASAGGLEALSAVLRDLPAGLPAAIVVLQHLGGQGSALVEILGRRAALPVAWAADGMALVPGEVLVCPPRRALEVNPDGTCTLVAGVRQAFDLPIDTLFESVADSFRERAIGVVLTGMGRDGAVGVRALERAGAVVIAQSEETAEQPSMPHAAIATGAVDLVLPLHEIGPVLAELALGAPLPRPRTEVEAAGVLFAGDGDVAAVLREIDWARTPLGAVTGWSDSMRAAVRVTLASPLPTLVLLGRELIQLYNDAYGATLGLTHHAALARPARDGWTDAWHVNAPAYERVWRGESFTIENAYLPLARRGAVEDAWLTLAYAPLRDERGTVVGVLQTAIDTTTHMLAERRLRTLHQLSNATAGATEPGEAARRSLGALGIQVDDVPFALVYLLDATRTHAHRAAVAGLDPLGPMAPHAVELAGGHPAWPLARVVREGRPVLVDDLATRFRHLRVGPDADVPNAAMAYPMRDGGADVSGVLVLGVAPRVALDERYHEFLALACTQIGASLVEARIRQRERSRLDALAELDRAKTEFFANVSHEFRTPLTLLVAPLGDALDRRDSLPPGVVADLDVASRNARRLLALVNTLLDFSRADAGELRARPEPVDLAVLTAEFVGAFRGAAESAGLQFVVRCEPLDAPMWVDVAMWERIVSSLLSNALKFTFAGEIVVELRQLPRHVELTVRDTGEGIPETELPNVFRRFHRVRATRSRSDEGAGVGLALVQELVRLQHGRVRVRSVVGVGTTFSVWLPLGSRQATDDAPARAPRSPATLARALADEALRWSAESTDATTDDALPIATVDGGARLLVVADNADLRHYLRRLLGTHWTVAVASDAESALGMLRHDPVDLVLADAMLPRMDGTALTAAIRRDDRLRDVRVVLLTAVAVESSAPSDVATGADDYVAKPFTSSDLVSRVRAQLEAARDAHAPSA